MDGNKRFVAGEPVSRPRVERVRQLAGGQSPFATVLACADSRVPVETLFDHEPGDIFVVRLAGNFVSDAAMGSIEYAIAVLKSPLVMVLGHTSCGAVRAAMDFVRSGERLGGHMQMLVDAIEPAARSTQSLPDEHPHDADSGHDWWDRAVVENVRMNVARLRSESPVIAQALRGNHEIVGGVYDLSTGAVTLL